MKILLVNKFYFTENRSGGVGTYVFGLQKILEKKGHEIIPWGVNEKETIKNPYLEYFLSPVETGKTKNIFKILKTLGRFFWSFEARCKLKKILKKEKIDIVHLNNIYHQMSPSFLPILKKKGIPVVMTVHDYNLVCPNYNLCMDGKEYKRAIGKKYWQCLSDKCVENSFGKSLVLVLKMYFHNKFLKIYQKNIDIFIAPSDFVRQKLLKAGFPEKKIQVLSHFVDMDLSVEK